MKNMKETGKHLWAGGGRLIYVVRALTGIPYDFCKMASEHPDDLCHNQRTDSALHILFQGEPEKQSADIASFIN